MSEPSQRLKDAFKTVQGVMLDLFGNATKPDGTTVPKVSVQLVAEGNNEPMITIDGWLYIIDSEEEREAIGRTVKVPVWNVSFGWNDPGVRYYKDGSGQPPSWEVEDVGNYPALWQAIRICAERILDQRIDNMADCAMADEMAREEM